MNKLDSGVSVVIPCFKSAQTIVPLVNRLHDVLDGTDYEIILVVDGSPDDTWQHVQKLAAHDRVRGLNLMRNYGQHNALLAGILDARKAVVVTMDDDLQHLPEEIPQLLKALTGDVDLVYGVAESEEHGFWRSLASRTVKSAMAIVLGVDYARNISAFRAFRAELVEPLRNLTDAFVSIDVCLSWATTRVVSVPVTMERRAAGASSYSVRSLMAHAFNMVTGYSDRPLKMVTALGLASAFLGLILFVYVLALFFTGTTEVPGFTTIAAMVAMFSGAQMLALGITGQYIGRLHFRSMSRPTYVIRQRVGDDSTHD